MEYYIVVFSGLTCVFLCLSVHSGVQHILCCVFPRIVYPILPVSLDCPFLITPSVFSNVYFQFLALQSNMPAYSENKTALYQTYTGSWIVFIVLPNWTTRPYVDPYRHIILTPRQSVIPPISFFLNIYHECKLVKNVLNKIYLFRK